MGGIPIQKLSKTDATKLAENLVFYDLLHEYGMCAIIIFVILFMIFAFIGGSSGSLDLIRLILGLLIILDILVIISTYFLQKISISHNQENEETIVDALIEKLQTSKGSERYAIARCMGNIGNPKAIDPLRKKMGDGDSGYYGCANVNISKILQKASTTEEHINLASSTTEKVEKEAINTAIPGRYAYLASSTIEMVEEDATNTVIPDRYVFLLKLYCRRVNEAYNANDTSIQVLSEDEEKEFINYINNLQKNDASIQFIVKLHSRPCRVWIDNVQMAALVKVNEFGIMNLLQ
jgi:hypothetical protein